MTISSSPRNRAVQMLISNFMFMRLLVPCLILVASGADFELFLRSYCRERGFHSIVMLDKQPSAVDLARSLARQGIRTALSDMADPLAGPDTLTVLHFTGTAALTPLRQAGRTRGFGPGKHWLLLVTRDLLKAALAELSIQPVLVDSDVVVGLEELRGHVKILEVYNAGKQRVVEVGSWNGTSLDVRGLQGYKFTRRGDLSGLSLRACAVGVNKMYFQFSGPPGQAQVTGGFAGNIFLALTRALNLTVKVHVLEGYAYGLYSPSNDSWSGLVGELQRAESDVSACEVSPTPERHRHLEFSMPFQIVGRRLYYRRPDKEFRADSFLRPFSLHTWLAVIVSLPLMASVAWLLGHFAPSQQQRANFSYAFVGMMYAALLQGWPNAPRDVPRRVLLWSAYVCYLIVSVSYSAKMVAMRTAEKPRLPIASLQDILEQRDWAFGFVGGALERNFFQSADSGTLLGRLWRERVLKKQENLVGDPRSGLQRALDSRFVFLGFYWGCQDALRSQFTANQACQLHVSMDEYYFKGGLAFGLPKHSPLREPIDYWLMRMRETGVMSRMESEAMPRPHVCETPPFASVTLKDVAPALILLATGIVISLLCLVLEMLWRARARKRH